MATDQERQEEIEALREALGCCGSMILPVSCKDKLRRLLARLEATPAEPTVRLADALAVVSNWRQRFDLTRDCVDCCDAISEDLTALGGGPGEGK
jgi:hypothetical protein